MSSLKLSLIVAMNNSNRGIGLNGTIPWRLPKDLKYFSRVTTSTHNPDKQNAVIMGKLTWLSIPKQYQPLPNRLNVVISTQLQPDSLGSDVLVFKSFEEAVSTLVKDYSQKLEHIYAIGGTRVYTSALANPLMERIYLTRVFLDEQKGDECKFDTFMEPEDFLNGYRKLEDVPANKNIGEVKFNTKLTENNLDFIFEVYEKL